MKQVSKFYKVVLFMCESVKERDELVRNTKFLVVGDKLVQYTKNSNCVRFSYILRETLNDEQLRKSMDEPFLIYDYWSSSFKSSSGLIDLKTFKSKLKFETFSIMEVPKSSFLTTKYFEQTNMRLSEVHEKPYDGRGPSGGFERG